MIKFDLQGFEEADKALRELPEQLQKFALQDATRTAIREARKEIKAAAPRGRGVTSVQKKYGYKKLKNSLRVKNLRRIKKAQAGARVDTGTAFWAYFYEKGTRNQPARPFFQPAFERSKGRVMKKLSEVLFKNIDKQWKKLERKTRR